MASLIRLVLSGLLCLPAVAQPAFAVDSVKPTPSSRLNHLRFDKCPGGGRFTTEGTPLSWVIGFGYRVSDDLIFGAPGWLRSFSDAYDIEGKSEDKVNDEQCRLMVRTLLQDRFKLSARMEMKELPAFALMLGKKSAGLRLVNKDDPPGGVKVNGGVQQALSEPDAPQGWSMARLADYLSNFAGRPVVDETGLPGTFAFSLEFARSPQEEEARQSVFTAIQEQLGLRLKATRAMIEVLDVDHIERPVAN